MPCRISSPGQTHPPGGVHGAGNFTGGFVRGKHGYHHSGTGRRQSLIGQKNAEYDHPADDRTGKNVLDDRADR